MARQELRRTAPPEESEEDEGGGSEGRAPGVGSDGCYDPVLDSEVYDASFIRELLGEGEGGDGIGVGWVDRAWLKQWSVQDLGGQGHLEALRESFCGGDVAQVVSQCRKEDNSRYSASEVEEMVADLEERGRTLNLPFCFCEGAVRLAASFVHASEGACGTDVEVGVYASRPGGDVADWHLDNNHNITIQLWGQKDWYIFEPDGEGGGAEAVNGSMGLHDVPRNALEAELASGAPGAAGGGGRVHCVTMRPGTALYVPPGVWHRVVPTRGERCLSVDLRAAHVLERRWIAEAVFASLRDRVPGSLYDGVGRQWCSVGSALGGDEWLRRFPVLRGLPFQPELSDGLERFATLDYLYDWVGGIVPATEFLMNPPAEVELHRIAAVQVKQRPANMLVLRVASASPLTGADYMRLNIVVPRNDPASELADALAQCHGRIRGSQGGRIAVHKDETFVVRKLVKVLLYANVLMVPPNDTAAQGTQQRATKRPRGG